MPRPNFDRSNQYKIWGMKVGKYASEYGNRAAEIHYEETRGHVQYWRKKYDDPLFHNKTYGGDYARLFTDDEENIIEKLVDKLLDIYYKYNVNVTGDLLIHDLKSRWGYEMSLAWLYNKLWDWKYSYRVCNIPELKKFTDENFERYNDFLSFIQQLDPQYYTRIKYIDESHFNGRKLKKIKRWCKRGIPPIAINEFKDTSSITITLLTNLGNNETPFFYGINEHSRNSQSVIEFIITAANNGHILRDDIVIIDNAPIHTSAETVTALETISNQIGCIFIFQPAYSPEFNACEFMFNFLKTSVRSDLSNRTLIDKIKYAFTFIDWNMMLQFYNKVLDSINSEENSSSLSRSKLIEVTPLIVFCFLFGF
jgi:hypothetical protein